MSDHIDFELWKMSDTKAWAMVCSATVLFNLTAFVAFGSFLNAAALMLCFVCLFSVVRDGIALREMLEERAELRLLALAERVREARRG